MSRYYCKGARGEGGLVDFSRLFRGAVKKATSGPRPRWFFVGWGRATDVWHGVSGALCNACRWRRDIPRASSQSRRHGDVFASAVRDGIATSEFRPTRPTAVERSARALEIKRDCVTRAIAVAVAKLRGVYHAIVVTRIVVALTRSKLGLSLPPSVTFPTPRHTKWTQFFPRVSLFLFIFQTSYVTHDNPAIENQALGPHESRSPRGLSDQRFFNPPTHAEPFFCFHRNTASRCPASPCILVSLSISSTDLANALNCTTARLHRSSTRLPFSIIRSCPFLSRFGSTCKSKPRKQ